MFLLIMLSLFFNFWARIVIPFQLFSLKAFDYVIQTFLLRNGSKYDLICLIYRKIVPQEE